MLQKSSKKQKLFSQLALYFSPIFVTFGEKKRKKKLRVVYLQQPITSQPRTTEPWRGTINLKEIGGVPVVAVVEVTTA